MGFEKKLQAPDGRVHVARTAAEANNLMYGQGYREVTSTAKAPRVEPKAEKAPSEKASP